MATDHSTFGPAVYSAVASAPTAIASVTATVMGIPVGEYAWATITAAMGIVGRHGWEAKVRGSFDVKGLIFDILTAPMLGIMIYVGCGWFGVEQRASTFFILFFTLLGPQWFIGFGSQVAGILAERLRSKL